MDALKYLETKGRMTNSCQIDCRNCPLAYKNNGKSIQCTALERDYSNEAIKIVEGWGKEHPFVTNVDKYKEIIRETFGDNFIDICYKKMFQYVDVKILTVVNVKSFGAESIKRRRKNNG